MDFHIAGIIAEYNPFHNGHAYLLHAARQAGATHTVALMSGNFVQRGGPALLPKELRAKAAVACGADLVLELPLPYAMATAQRFAQGAVSLLGALGCVETLAFGSECGDAALLTNAVAALESAACEAQLRHFLVQGITYAKARQQALEAVSDRETAALLATPNNTLAIAYLSEIRKAHLPIQPLTIQRAGVAHHGTQPNAQFASATYLRTSAAEHGVSSLEAFVPVEAFTLYQQANEIGLLPCREEPFYPMLLAALRGMERTQFASLPDLSEGLHDRFYHSVRHASTYPALLELSKTKRYPLARIRRLVWSAFLGITARDSQTPPPYLRILAMNARGRELLSLSRPTLPLSASLRDLERHGGSCARFAALEARAGDLYALGLPTPRICGSDYTIRM